MTSMRVKPDSADAEALRGAGLGGHLFAVVCGDSGNRRIGGETDSEQWYQRFRGTWTKPRLYLRRTLKSGAKRWRRVR